MLAPLPFMVPSCRQLLPGPSAPVSGTWLRLERRQRPGPGSTKPHPLHLRPPQAVGSRRALQASAPTAPRVQVRCPGLAPGAVTGGDPCARQGRCRLYPPRRCGAARRWGSPGGGGAWAVCLESRPGSCCVAPRPVTVTAAPWVREAPPCCSRGFPNPGCFPPVELGLRPPLRCHQPPLGFVATPGLSLWFWARSWDGASSGPSRRRAHRLNCRSAPDPSQVPPSPL